MMKFLFLISAAFLLSCSSSSKTTKQNSRPKYEVNVKYEDIRLKSAGEWLGGTEQNPKYYTENAQEILTPIFGVNIVPVTRRSINDQGNIVYPHIGFEVVGDLKIEHFLALMRKIKNQKFDRNSYKPPVIVADSNFLEKGAQIKSSQGKVLAVYEYRLLNWYKVK